MDFTSLFKKILGGTDLSSELELLRAHLIPKGIDTVELVVPYAPGAFRPFQYHIEQSLGEVYGKICINDMKLGSSGAFQYSFKSVEKHGPTVSYFVSPSHYQEQNKRVARFSSELFFYQQPLQLLKAGVFFKKLFDDPDYGFHLGFSSEFQDYSITHIKNGSILRNGRDLLPHMGIEIDPNVPSHSRR